MFKLLPEFFNNAYFNRGSIKIRSKDYTMVKGQAVNGTESTETLTVRKVLVPMNAKEIMDTGLGEYNTGEAFYLYVDKVLRFSNGKLLQKGDVIEYEGFSYKMITVLDYRTHGFYTYVLNKFEGKLND
jgi:hypothetical protein